MPNKITHIPGWKISDEFADESIDMVNKLQMGKNTLVEMLHARMMVPGYQDIPITPTTIKTMKDIVEDMIKYRSFFDGQEENPFLIEGVFHEENIDEDFIERIDIFIDTVKNIVLRDIDTYNDRRRRQAYGW